MGENNVAQTRKHKKMKNKKNTLVVPASINQIPDNDIVRLHTEGTFLTLIRVEAEKSDIRVVKDGSTLGYVLKKELYYHESKRGDKMSCVYSQLVKTSK